MLAPNNNRGMTYQKTDEEHITNLQEYCVGAKNRDRKLFFKHSFTITCFYQ
jgi:hypothetical protein